MTVDPLRLIEHGEPEWLIFEGRAYRRSDDFPADPPWTHVDRASSKVAPSANYQGAVGLLRDLAAEARDFSTQADYKVSLDVEEAFVEALDAAERYFGGQS